METTIGKGTVERRQRALNGKGKRKMNALTPTLLSAIPLGHSSTRLHLPTPASHKEEKNLKGSTIRIFWLIKMRKTLIWKSSSCDKTGNMRGRTIKGGLM